MVWRNGGPGSHIPERTKRTVRDRQQDCCIGLIPQCWGTIDEYDHIINVKRTKVDRAQLNNPDLIQGLCMPCHKWKTQQESLAARRRHLRPPPKHPSSL